MKKIFILGLIGILVLGLGAFSFANNFNRGFRGGMRNQGFQGLNNDSDFIPNSTSDDIRGFGPCFNQTNRLQNDGSNFYGGMMGYGFMNNNFRFNQTDEFRDVLSDLTGLTDDEISDSNKTYYEIAKDNKVLDEFHEKILEIRTKDLEKLVEDEVISQEDADFMLERMEEMNNLDYFGGMMGYGFMNNNFRFNQPDEFRDILSDLTGLTDKEISDSNKTYYEIAKDNEVLDEFHEKIIEIRKEDLEKLVEDEVISQEDADFMLERMEDMNDYGYYGGFGHHRKGFRR